MLYLRSALIAPQCLCIHRHCLLHASQERCWALTDHCWRVHALSQVGHKAAQEADKVLSTPDVACRHMADSTRKNTAHKLSTRLPHTYCCALTSRLQETGCTATPSLTMPESGLHPAVPCGAVTSADGHPTWHALLHDIFWQGRVCQPLLPSPELLCLHQVVHKPPVLSIQARAVGGLRLADLLLAMEQRE